MIKRLLDFIFPRTCCVCGCSLNQNEQHLCLSCMMDIPATNLHKVKFNRIEQMFAGQVPIERASSLFYYHKAGKYASILHDLKYRNAPDLGRFIARKLSTPLFYDGFFSDIDYLLPIPLHYTKYGKRGYNQSTYIAQGIADTTRIEVDTKSLIAKYAHDTQTNRHRYERWKNTSGIFTLRNADKFCGKHIMLVDDVITTGSTITSAATTIYNTVTDYNNSQNNIRISVISLALADD